MRVKAIACEVLYREICLLAAQSPNIVDVEFVSQGLHDLKNEDMCANLQKRVDAVDAEKYDAVALVYGLCNNGVVGLTSRDIPLVIPRAHDCITLFFGSREAYKTYFDAHPGTYFATSGWLERDSVNLEDMDGGVMHQLGLDRTLQQYIEQYGEDNAKYIMETLGGWESSYKQCTYIDMGVCEGLGFDEKARAQADEKGWSFEKVPGDLSLMRKLIDGQWDDDFLVVKPGYSIVATVDDDIVAAKPGGTA